MRQDCTELLFSLLSEVNGMSFISIDTLTYPLMNKTINSAPNPHYGRISKRQTGSSVMAFQNKRVNGYESLVKRRLLAEGKDPNSFVLSKRRWGTRIENMPIVEYVGEYYLEVIFLHPGPVQYLLDGKPIDKNQILGLREYGIGEEQQAYLSNKVILRVFSFSSLTRIRINQRTYELDSSCISPLLIDTHKNKGGVKMKRPDPILGYWITYPEGRYFVRDHRDALPEHKTAFKSPIKGVTVEPVTEHIKIAPYVVLQNNKTGAIYYLKWTPLSPYPIEHNHEHQPAYTVLDFAESITEAEAVCSVLRKQGL